jgi:hypothetical protein
VAHGAEFMPAALCPKGYAIVTDLLVGLHAGLVLLATRVLSSIPDRRGRRDAVCAATLFNPLRQRVQRVVGRRFKRTRCDADESMADFAARRKDAVDLNSVQDDLANVVY